MIACHNRCALTLRALATLRAQRLPPGLSLTVFLVDDGSSDGTSEQVHQHFPDVRVLSADGTLFWNGAMALAQKVAMEEDFSFHLWLNDDVTLHETALGDLIALHDDEIAAGRRPPIVIGSTMDSDTSSATYGGYTRRPGIHPFRFLRLFAAPGPAQSCATFNGNCVLVPRSVFQRLGTIDPAFTGGQPLGDTDYGLRAERAGIPMLLAPRPVGMCEANKRTSPWENAALPLRQRIASLSGPLGPLRRQTAHFYRRHGGPAWLFWWSIPIARGLCSALFPPKPRQKEPRFAMIEPVLSWYRLPLLTRLRDHGHVQCRVFHGNASSTGEPSAPIPPGIDHCRSHNFHYPLGAPRVFWSTHVWTVLRGGYDVVMMAEHVYTVSNWVIWLASRIIGRPRVILTGHFNLGKKPANFLSRVRRMWLRNADFLAPYTPSGALNCQAIGIAENRLKVLYNTLDIKAIRDAAANAPPLSQTERRTLDIDGKHVFLFIGRLYPDKMAPLAAEATTALCRLGYPSTLLVIGAGQDRATLERQAAAGAPIRLLGECRDTDRLAQLFSLAEAVLMPDAAGLSINHAFAHGLAVILGPGRNHGVEIEYVQHGVNGLIADAMTPQALAGQMRRLICEPELARELRRNAILTADHLGMDSYAERLEELVQRAARA